MNIKKTLILALVLAAAALYLTKISEPRRAAELVKDKLLSSLGVEDVVRIDVERRESPASDAKGYGLVRGGSSAVVGGSQKWEIVGLAGAALDDPRVDTMLRGARDVSCEGPIEEERLLKDFSVYGLDKPSLTLVFTLKDGSQREFACGKKSEYLNKRYCKVSGFPGIYMVDDAAFQSLNKDRSELRRKNPVRFADGDVRLVTLESTAGKVRISQPVVGEWRIEEPGAFEASSVSVNELLSAIRDLSADEFIDGVVDRLGEYGLDAPQASLVVQLRERVTPSSFEVRVSKRDADTFFWLSGAPSVFKVKGDKLPAVTKSALDLREKRLVRVSTNAFAKIVSGGSAEGGVEMISSDEGWKVNGKVGDRVFVDQLVQDIANLTAVDFPESVPDDAFTTPFLTMTVTEKDPARPTTTVIIGKETERSGEKVRFTRVKESGLTAFVKGVEAMRIVPHEGALVEKAPERAEKAPESTATH